VILIEIDFGVFFGFTFWFEPSVLKPQMLLCCILTVWCILLRAKTQDLKVKFVSSNQVLVAEAEFDEMWSFVSDKSRQYWL
jgi:hypothetical protein